MATKYQQVSVDLVNMVFTACTYLALAGAAWIFLRLLQACFWLPRHLKKQNDVHQLLQDKVESYEKYVLECEEKEKLLDVEGNLEKPVEIVDAKPEDQATAQRWKERRDCLEILKRELKRVRDGGDPYDWDHLLDDTDDEEKKGEPTITEVEDKEEVNEEEVKEENPKPDEQDTRCEMKKEK